MAVIKFCKASLLGFAKGTWDPVKIIGLDKFLHRKERAEAV